MTNKKLPMTNEEILISYRESKDKKLQVKILSELNVCSQEQIKEILIQEGVRQCELPRNRKKKEDAEEKFQLRDEEVQPKETQEQNNFSETEEQIDPLVRQALLHYREQLVMERAQTQTSVDLARQILEENETSLRLLQEAIHKIDRMTAEGGEAS